jgi:hypothetical protein
MMQFCKSIIVGLCVLLAARAQAPDLSGVIGRLMAPQA